MSPTSRSSRRVSASTTSSESVALRGILDDALEQRRDVAADRRQRRAQLVRDRHEEVPLAHLGLGEACGHLVEALGELADLARRRASGISTA